MTVEEYDATLTRVEAKIARVGELQAAIRARQGRISAEQASAFAFNDIRQPISDVTAVADVATPTFSAGASNVEQAVGSQGMAEIADRDPATIGQDDSIEAIFARVNEQLGRGQGGDAPASSTQVRVSDPTMQIDPGQAQLNPGGDKPIMQSIDESLKAGGAALAESVTMGAITLSERDRKAIEKSPIAGVVGSLIGDAVTSIGAYRAGKMTFEGFKELAPNLIGDWFNGGEEIGRVLVNAAAREGIGGAYWNVLKQTIGEIKNPEEQKTWNDRLVSFGTDVGLFAGGGMLAEGVMAGRALKPTASGGAPQSQIDDIVRPNEEVGRGPAAAIADEGTISPSVDTQLPPKAGPTAAVEYQAPREASTDIRARQAVPLREEPSAEQLAALQDKFKPLDKVVEEGRGPVESRLGKMLVKDAIATKDAEIGTNILMEMSEKGISPQKVHEEFINNIYDNLPEDVRVKFNSLIEKQTGETVGYYWKDHKSMAKALVDLGDDADLLEGSERGFAVMEAEAVRRFSGEGAALLDAPKAGVADTRARQAVPLREEEVGVEVAEVWAPKRYDYAAMVDDQGKATYGQVGSEVSEKGTVTFKPRKGKAIEVPADQLREPTSVPRVRDDIEDVLEAAANKRRVKEEMSSAEAEPTAVKAGDQTSPLRELNDDVGVIGGEEVGVRPLKPLGQRVKETAERIEGEAKARVSKKIKDIGSGEKLYDVVGATGEALSIGKDLAIIGAAKIAKGAVEFAEWSAEMVKDLGDTIKPHLDAIYKASRDQFHKERAKTTVQQHLEYMQDISQPFELRPRVVNTEGGFRTGYQRFRDIKQGLREQRTGQKLRGKALEEAMIDDELKTFTEEAWKAGAPVMRTKQGTLIPVFDSKADAERIWDYVYGQAKAKLDKTPKANEAEITREARKLFLQEMVDRGVALKLKRTPIQLSPDVKRKTDLSLYIILKADMGAEKLKSALAGIPENDLVARQAKLTELGMERGLLSPAVRAQGTYVPLEFAAYGGFKDVAGETLDPTRLVQAIDGALSVESKVGLPGQAGPAERMVMWRTRDMLKQKMQWQGDMEAAGKRVLDGLKKKDRETVTDVLEELATSEAKDLSVKGLLARSEFRDITTDERILQAALDLRPIYDDVLDMQNLLRTQRSQKPIPKRAFYSPRKMKEVSAWQELLGLNADPANLLSTGALIPDFVLPNKPRIGHDMQRILLEPKYELEKDAGVLLERYLNAAARDIFDTSIIQNTKAFMDQLEVMGFGKSAVSLRDWVGQSFAGAPHAIDKGISGALSSSLGEVVGKNWQKWSGKFRGALARSVFPANISWNLFLQTSSGVLTHTRYGTRNSIEGAMRWFGDKTFRDEVAENAYSFIVKTQQGGKIGHQDFNQGMARAIQLERKPLEKATDAANFLSEWIEKHMTGWSIAAGYEDGLKKGLTGKALWEYASDAGAKTQSMYNKEDLPGLLRSNGVKTIAPFQTFAFEMFNTIKEVAGKVGTPPANAQEKTKAILRFMAGATAVNIAFEAASGRKPWEVGSAIPFAPMFYVPIKAKLEGNNADQAATRGLPSPVGIGLAFADAVEDVMTDGNWNKMISWAIRYGTAGAGIPGGTQLNRIYQGIKAISDGGVVDKNGKIIFPITGAKEQMQALFGGPWSTEAGQAKIAEREKGMIEFAEPTSGIGKVGAKVAEALPIVGDVVEFKKPKDEGIEIVPDPNPSRRRRSRPRSRR